MRIFILMKTPLTLSLVLGSLLSFSQKTDEDYSPAQYKTSNCRSSFQKIQLEGANTAENIQQYLKKTLANLKDNRTDLKFNYKSESPGGYHYSFTQTFNGVEVYQSEIKVNIDKQNVIRSIFDNSENTGNWNLNTTGAVTNSVIALKDDVPVLCERKIINHTEVLEANSEMIFERDVNSYFAQDSLVNGRVFLPDPLTSALQNYVCPYCDNSDATSFQLDAELQTVNILTTFTGSQFLLENSFVRVSDFDLPTIAPATSTTGQFYFNRSQSGFEDVNAFYHINTMHQHIHTLGFGCADSLIEIDPHAMSGADNSYFSPLASPKRLYFGTGNVDDAEDADVCVHEYGHFVSETAAPSSNVGQQRNSLDEGFGDYLAASYSGALSNYNSNWVFNWDGHNEFWNGRILDAAWVYPDDITGSIYHNGQIWSAILWCIRNSIGRDATDSIILQAHYSYAQNLSMPQAGQLLLDADTLLTGGKYTCPIYACLFYRGLAPNNPLINCSVGIKEEENFPIQFLNHDNSFSLINPNGEKIQLQILNLQGQLIASTDENQPVFNYQNSNLSSGIYLINIRLINTSKTFKWSKLN